jgi:chromate reductase
MPGSEPSVLGVCGSLRRDSYNSVLLDLAARALPAGFRYARYRELKALPPFDEDDEATPHGAVDRFRALLRGADGLIVATPEYNASIPGQLKNAVDWGSRPAAEPALRDLPVLVIGASTSSFGALWAQSQLRSALGVAGARVIDAELPVAEADEQFAPDGSFADAGLAQRLGDLVAQFAAEVSALRAVS